MGHGHNLSPDEQRAADLKIGKVGFGILLLVTLGEVGIALIGNGHLIDGFTITKWIMAPLMIAMSLYKAYYIVSIFMHLGHEIGGFAMTVVMPMTLLIWGCIAFLWEGDYARNSRNYVKDARPGVEAPAPETPSGEETSMVAPENLSKELTFM